jgi:hypothetical protein
MREYAQKWFIKFIVKDIFHTITVDDIFKVDKNGNWTFKGKEMDLETVAKLKVQAANFKDSFLWKILKSELQWSAAKTLLEKGTTETDIRVAQIQGYLTQVIDRKLDDLTK